MIDAAEKVAGASIPLIAQLSDKSMLSRSASGRFEIHELLRQFAHEKLQEHGSLDKAREKHLAYFLALAEEGEFRIRGPDQVEWLDRLEKEHDNLREALVWSRNRKSESDDPPVGAGLRLAGALGQFWDTRGYFGEGRNWLEEALQEWSEPSVARVKALIWAGLFADRQTDNERFAELVNQSLALSQELGYEPGIAEALFHQSRVAQVHDDAERAEALGKESLNLWQKLGDKREIARALGPLAEGARDHYHYARACELFEKSLALFREVGDTREIAGAYRNLSNVEIRRGDYEKANIYAMESLDLYRELKDKHGIATLLRELGEISLNLSQPERATSLYQESVALFRELGDKHCTAMSLIGLGRTALHQHDIEGASSSSKESLAISRESKKDSDASLSLDLLARTAMYQGEEERARRSFREGLDLQRKVKYKPVVASLLEGLAKVNLVLGKPEMVARLLGAADALRDAAGFPLPLIDREGYESDISASRTALGVKLFEKLWAEGHEMSMKQALEYALRDIPEA